MLIAYGDDHWFDFALRVLTLAAAKASVRTFVEMGLLNFSISLFEDEFGLIITGLRVSMILRRSC